jgi:hypothetical protein
MAPATPVSRVTNSVRDTISSLLSVELAARERVGEPQRRVRRRKSARPNVTGWPIVISILPPMLFGSRATPSWRSSVPRSKIDALAHEAILLEDEHGADRPPHAAARRGQPAVGAKMRTGDHALSDDAVVSVVYMLDRDGEVRERAVIFVVERLDLGRTVEDLPRGNDLVAGMVEGGQRRLAIMPILSRYVLPHDRLAALANGRSCIARHAAPFVECRHERSSQGHHEQVCRWLVDWGKRPNKNQTATQAGRCNPGQLHRVHT